MNNDEIIKKLAEKLKRDFKHRFVDTQKKIAESFLPTGNPLVDWVLGRGLPVGKIIEIYGAEGSGKSTLAYQMLASIYSIGGVPVLFDTEASFDTNRGKELGLEQLVIEVPTYIEEAFEMIEKTIEGLNESKTPGLIVWDSLAATPSKSLRLEGKREIGAKARELTENLEKMLNILENSTVSLVVLNQVRSIINKSFFGGSIIDSPSAHALRHEALIRCEINKIGSIKESDGTVIGIISELMSLKNKIVSPFRRVKLVLFFKGGFSIPHSVIENAIEIGVVKFDKGWCDYKGKKFRRKEADKLDKDVLAEILNETINKLEEKYTLVYQKLGLKLED